MDDEFLDVQTNSLTDYKETAPPMMDKTLKPIWIP